MPKIVEAIINYVRDSGSFLFCFVLFCFVFLIAVL